jgi:hypothetical protein
VSDTELAATLAEYLAGAALIISSTELLSIRNEYDDGGILSCSLARRVRAAKAGLFRRSTVSFFVRKRVVILALMCRTAVGVGLILLDGAPFHVVLLGLALISTLLVNYSMLFGQDGSDQMLLVVLAGLLVTRAGQLWQLNALQLAGLTFIALQCTLSYLTAGIAKLFGSSWRNGTALQGILRTRSYGTESVSMLLDTHPRLAKSMSYGVVLYELLFPIAFILPFTALIAFIAVGAAFHIMIAYVMGLNTFLWSFGATYPAVVYIAGQL